MSQLHLIRAQIRRYFVSRLPGQVIRNRKQVNVRCTELLRALDSIEGFIQPPISPHQHGPEVCRNSCRRAFQ